MPDGREQEKLEAIALQYRKSPIVDIFYSIMGFIFSLRSFFVNGRGKKNKF